MQPILDLGPHVPHIGACRDGEGNIFAAVTRSRPAANDDAVLILKRNVRTGAWSVLATLDEATYGKPGYGTLQNVANNLHLILSLRNAAGEQVVMEHVITGVCVSWREAIQAQITQALAGLGSASVSRLAIAVSDALAPFRGQ